MTALAFLPGEESGLGDLVKLGGGIVPTGGGDVVILVGGGAGGAIVVFCGIVHGFTEGIVDGDRAKHSEVGVIKNVVSRAAKYQSLRSCPDGEATRIQEDNGSVAPNEAPEKISSPRMDKM